MTSQPREAGHGCRDSFRVPGRVLRASAGKTLAWVATMMRSSGRVSRRAALGRRAVGDVASDQVRCVLRRGPYLVLAEACGSSEPAAPSCCSLPQAGVLSGSQLDARRSFRAVRRGEVAHAARPIEPVRGLDGMPTCVRVVHRGRRGHRSFREDGQRVHRRAGAAVDRQWSGGEQELSPAQLLAHRGEPFDLGPVDQPAAVPSPAETHRGRRPGRRSMRLLTYLRIKERGFRCPASSAGSPRRCRTTAGCRIRSGSPPLRRRGRARTGHR